MRWGDWLWREKDIINLTILECKYSGTNNGGYGSGI